MNSNSQNATVINNISLLEATINGYTDIVSEYLKSYSCQNIANYYDETSLLHIASSKNYKDIVIELLNHNANAEELDGAGDTPLIYATKCGHFDVVKVLLNYNAKVEAKDSDGCTSLHIASEKGYKDIVIELLNHRADLKAKCNFKRTPLIYASTNGYKDIVIELLKPDRLNSFQMKYNASSEEVDEDDNTPLICASRNGHIDIVEELLNCNASSEAKNDFNQTAYDVAVLYNHNEIIKLLKPNKS